MIFIKKELVCINCQMSCFDFYTNKILNEAKRTYKKKQLKKQCETATGALIFSSSENKQTGNQKDQKSK